MSYIKVFPMPCALIAVIQVKSFIQTSRSIDVAIECGADGVFLKNTGPLDCLSLYDIYKQVRDQHKKDNHKKVWIGIKWTNLTPKEAIHSFPSDADGLWFDNLGLQSDENQLLETLKEIPNLRAQREIRESSIGKSQKGTKVKWLCFGTIIAKSNEDSTRLAKLAMPYLDVIVTSVKSIDLVNCVERVHGMKQAIAGHPFGVSDDIALIDLPYYVPYADCLLVTPGIHNSHTELYPPMVKQFSNRMKSKFLL